MNLRIIPSRNHKIDRRSLIHDRYSAPLQVWIVPVIAGLFILSLFMPLPVKAAGDSQPTCAPGWVYSTKQKKCVKKTSEVLTDDDLYAAAYSLVEEERYALARDLFYRIKDQRQPRVLNYIGFTTRKLGQIDDGIRYYKLALELDPNYVQARQYLGEGYLQKGEVGLAKKELDEIAARCGTDCKHYKTLAVQISEFERRT